MSLYFYIFKVTSYLKFYLNADTLYRIHSPYLYALIERVIETDGEYYFFGKAEYIRERLLRNSNAIDHLDFGARGSVEGLLHQKKICDIAKTSLSRREKSEKLFKLVLFLKPKRILELGSSLGLNTMYLKSAAGLASDVHSIEGSPAISSFAVSLYKRYGFDIVQHLGRFDEVLPILFENEGGFDLFYVDGNHTYESTIHYVNLIRKKISEQSVIILDDIYWSRGMQKAWNELISDPMVTLSLDLYDVGILFFRQEFKSKHHLRIVEGWKKPWQRYLPG